MIYTGMDVSSKSLIIHAIGKRKKVVFKGEIDSSRAALRKLVKDLGSDTKLFVFEAGNQLKWIALTLKKIKGVHVYVVNPNEVKWISQSNGKTDKVDARKLAELARADLLPRPVHVVDGHIRELRELISARETLQSKRISLINTIRGLMLQEGCRLPTKFFQSVDWQLKLERSKIGINTKTIICAYMQSIESLHKTEFELTEKIMSIKDKRCPLLETIPGIGGLTSRVILSALDDVRRFDNKRTVSKYGGLSPTIYQSGNVNHLGRINRNGRRELRRVLLQCAHTVARMKSFGSKPLRDFFERVMKKRGKKIAIVALSRKLLTVAYGILKTGEPYDPAKLIYQTVK
jgi:transposase